MKKKEEAASKRIESAQDEHFQALSFGFRIAQGLRNGVETHRLKAYADWFFENYLLPHLEIEKEYLFPILGLENVRVKKALANHRRLLRLFNNTDEVYKSLNRIEDEIGRYIRFEERILYKQIEEKASVEQLNKAREQFKKLSVPEHPWKDKFWES